MKEITMSFGEFYAMERGEINIKDILTNKKAMKYLDKKAGLILANNKLKTIALTTIAHVCMEMGANADIASEMSGKAYALSNDVCRILIVVAGCICSICCLVEIIKGIIGRNSSDALATFIKYLITFIVAAAVPASFKFLNVRFGYLS